jgi:hypothetical protein
MSDMCLANGYNGTEAAAKYGVRAEGGGGSSGDLGKQNSQV